MTAPRVEVCARCGHATPTCAGCGEEWPFLGAGIGEQRYCHSFVDGAGTSCYEASQWEWSAGLLDGLPWVHWPRDDSEAVAS